MWSLRVRETAAEVVKLAIRVSRPNASCCSDWVEVIDCSTMAALRWVDLIKLGHADVHLAQGGGLLRGPGGDVGNQSRDMA